MLGLHAPRGAGWITNPRKAAYNRVYNRTSKSCCGLFILIPLAIFIPLTIKVFLK